ncbi:MAG: hypothetical protein ACLQU2_12815 [Candidatus Binataceae bacterium]
MEPCRRGKQEKLSRRSLVCQLQLCLDGIRRPATGATRDGPTERAGFIRSSSNAAIADSRSFNKPAPVCREIATNEPA